jgi:2-polyprenyl-6-methoxyphenol hydroxylase-like FAD-dependent oxidoreductase
LEIFDDLGIAQDAVDSGVWLHGVSAFNDGVAGPSMDVPTDLPFGSLSLAQFDTERLLEACLHRCGGRVFYGRTLTGFEAKADGARAQVQGPDGETQAVDCRWLVGCDGAHSKVRATLGLDFAGGQYPQTFVLADLEVDWDLPRGRMYRFNTGAQAGQSGSAALAAVPVHGSSRRYRLSTVVPDAALNTSGDAMGETFPATLDQITALMSPILPKGTTLSSLHWSSVYRVSHRIVPTYAKGRVFLAGDAAHLHPPAGGQGMNTGLQDAHNLAWKLALACRGLASEALLDSYSTERHAVGLDVVENTSRALNDVLAQRAQLPGMRETQLLVSYRGSPIVVDERAGAGAALLAAGDRLPNAGQLRRPFVGHALRLHERLGRGRHVLLGFIDDDPAAALLAQMLNLLRATLGESADGCAIAPQGGSPLAALEDLPLLIDAEGEFAAAVSAKPGSVWLVRPDGYIGWCSETPSIDGLRSFLNLVVRPPPPSFRG